MLFIMAHFSHMQWYYDYFFSKQYSLISTSQSRNSSVTASTSPLANYLARPAPVTENPLKQSLELEF